MMTRGLPDEDGVAHRASGREAVLEASARGGALALGPGLGPQRAARSRSRARSRATPRCRWCSTPTA